MFSSSLRRVVTDLRVSVSKFSAWSPGLMSVSHLRTVTNTNFNKAQPRHTMKVDLPEGQSIVPLESELRDETISKINNCLEEGPGRMFAVVHVRGHQHKITDGDLLMVQADLGAPLGAKIILQKLLALGARDFTLLGRPVLPLDLANVEATVIEKTLSRTKVIQAFKPRSRVLRYRFNRVKWTLLRVNSINVTGRVGQTLDKSGMDKSLLQ